MSHVACRTRDGVELRSPEMVMVVSSTSCKGKLAISDTASSFSAPGSEVDSEMVRVANSGGYGDVNPSTRPVNF
jgi:hypothetical protein